MQDFIKRQARPQIFNLKPYTPGKPVEEVKRELGIEDIIKMASNENPLGPSPLAVQALKESLDSIHVYPDGNCFYLKHKLAEFLDIQTNQLLLGNGSDELLKLLVETFVNPQDEVIFASPTFSEYEFTATIMGAKCIAVPLLNFKHDLTAMLDAIREQTKIIYLCNPNNPTGTIVSRAEMDGFMAQVPGDVLVVFDEAYFEYVESPDFAQGMDYLQDYSNVIVSRTFSKIYGLAGLRIGYMVAHPEIVAAVERITEPFNVNLLAQVGALAALDDSKHLSASQTVNREGKVYLYRQLEQMGLKYVPTEANFIFLDTGQDCQPVFRELLSRGVIVRTGDNFGFPTYIRVTIGNPEQNQRFIKTLQEILKI
ncbi:MAG: histidinol-phosphate transaminase [Syntrophomonadaceae bacterium]|jgi:histidinol-phosphate aminotransferase|nr:histidinol-phosphate transaminase [Syntrophomonadaceae bacterium]